MANRNLSAAKSAKNDEFYTQYASTSVLDWIESVFPETHDEMCGLKWGEFYERHHKTAYNASTLARRVNDLLADDAVTDKRGVFAYVLGGETEPKLLNVRVFKPAEARAAYRCQTDAATKKGVSNCSLCALGPAATSTRIWDFKDMDADHAADVAQFNKQYGGLTEKRTDKFHDRYQIIDNAALIRVEALLNHLGRRCFAFSTLAADFIPDIMARVP